jgi:predicted Abi (CAAX) family protease
VGRGNSRAFLQHRKILRPTPTAVKKNWYEYENISAKSVASVFVRYKKLKYLTWHHSGTTATLNLIPWTTVLLQKLTVPQLVKKISAF